MHDLYESRWNRHSRIVRLKMNPKGIMEKRSLIMIISIMVYFTLFFTLNNSVFGQEEFIHLLADNTTVNIGVDDATFGFNVSTSYAAGRIGSAFDFTNNNYVTSSNFEPSTDGFGINNNFTIGLWFFIDTFAEDDMIFYWRDAGGTLSLDIRTKTGANRVHITWNNGGTFYSVADASATTVWYHIFIVHNESESKFYFFLNNTLLNAGGTSDATYSVQVEEVMSLGAQTDGAFAFDGRVDDIRLYNRSLTQTERDTIYNVGSGTQDPLGVDSCTYTSGEWLIQGSDSCVLVTTNLNFNNIIINGTGTTTVKDGVVISNWTSIKVINGATLRIQNATVRSRR